MATSVEMWVGLYRTRGLRSKNDYVLKSYKDIVHSTENIANNNNYKWSINFKNCESLYCTPVTCIICFPGGASGKEPTCQCR